MAMVDDLGGADDSRLDDLVKAGCIQSTRAPRTPTSLEAEDRWAACHPEWCDCGRCVISFT